MFRNDEGTLLDAPHLSAFITAAAHGHGTIILGAWGCRVFGNDPHLVPEPFDEALSGAFKGVYRQVLFSIMDRWRDRRMIGPFRIRFEGVW